MKSAMKLSVQIPLVLLSAVLLPLCFPPFGWWPLVLLVYPSLFLATTNTTPRRAFYLALLQGIIGYGATLYWLFSVFGTAAIPLFVILALFSAFFCFLLNFLSKQIQSPVLRGDSGGMRPWLRFATGGLRLAVHGDDANRAIALLKNAMR